VNQSDSKVLVFGARGSTEAFAIRDFLHRCDVPFQWIEVSSDQPDALRAHAGGYDAKRLPLSVFPDGTRLECPTVRHISEKLGLFLNPSRSEFDLAIYGAGPAGLSTAVYGASEGLKTVVVERFAVGGQASTSPKIENHLGLLFDLVDSFDMSTHFNQHQKLLQPHRPYLSLHFEAAPAHLRGASKMRHTPPKSSA
jgi:hypothetical protein